MTRASFSDDPPTFLRHPHRRGRRRQGIIYENQTKSYLADRFGEFFIPGPWLRFDDASGPNRWCQPDGILFDPQPGRIIVTEIKIRHCSEAWFQIFDLYFPVLQKIFPKWKLVGCEIVRWFDPATSTPEKPRLRKNPFDSVKGEFNVHIWTP